MKQSISKLLCLVTVVLLLLTSTISTNALFRVRCGVAVPNCEDLYEEVQGPASNCKPVKDINNLVVGIEGECANLNSWCLRMVCEDDGPYFEGNEGFILPGTTTYNCVLLAPQGGS